MNKTAEKAVAKTHMDWEVNYDYTGNDYFFTDNLQ